MSVGARPLHLLGPREFWLIKLSSAAPLLERMARLLSRRIRRRSGLTDWAESFFAVTLGISLLEDEVAAVLIASIDKSLA